VRAIVKKQIIIGEIWDSIQKRKGKKKLLPNHQEGEPL